MTNFTKSHTLGRPQCGRPETNERPARVRDALSQNLAQPHDRFTLRVHWDAVVLFAIFTTCPRRLTSANEETPVVRLK